MTARTGTVGQCCTRVTQWRDSRYQLRALALGYQIAGWSRMFQGDLAGVSTHLKKCDTQKDLFLYILDIFIYLQSASDISTTTRLLKSQKLFFDDLDNSFQVYFTMPSLIS